MTTFPRLDPTRPHQIIIVLSAHNSNPNGDPDADNQPRTNPFTGHGLISAVSIKRKARDYVQERYVGQSGMEVFIRQGEVMGTLAFDTLRRAGIQVSQGVSFTDDDLATLLDQDLPEAFELVESELRYNKTLKKGEITKLLARLKGNGVGEDLLGRLEALTTAKQEKGDRQEMQKAAGPVMAQRFWDARLFGYTAPDSAGKTRGPVQVTDAESLTPVNLISHTLTRVARSKTSDKDGDGQIARRTVVDHAVYVATAFVNPKLAAIQGVSADDLQAFLEGLWYGQEVARSSARPDVRVEALVILSHEHPYGSAPYPQLAERLQIQHPGGTDVRVMYDQDRLPSGVQVEVITSRANRPQEEAVD